jgi:hypothetical protein
MMLEGNSECRMQTAKWRNRPKGSDLGHEGGARSDVRG